MPRRSKVLFLDEIQYWILFGNQGTKVWRGNSEEAHHPRHSVRSQVENFQSVMIQDAVLPAHHGKTPLLTIILPGLFGQ